MSWIKIDSTLTGKPEVHKLARKLKLDRWSIVGRLIELWGWCDTHTEDGRTMLSRDDVDAMCGKRGFADALIGVGWLSEDSEDEVSIVDFARHNGASAKRRAEVARDVAKSKAKKKASGKQKVSNDCLPPAYLEKEKDKNNVVVGKATLDSAAASDDSEGSAPAPPPHHMGASEDFLDWLKAIAPAHPSLRQSRTLAPDVLEGALAAFGRCPQAAELGDLLAAYFADRLQEDSHRKVFYRPTGQRKFFENLEDVISHAERWDKETGWSRKRRRAAKADPPAKPAPPAQSEPAMSDAEREAFMADMKRELGMEARP